MKAIDNMENLGQLKATTKTFPRPTHQLKVVTDLDLHISRPSRGLISLEVAIAREHLMTDFKLVIEIMVLRVLKSNPLLVAQ